MATAPEILDLVLASNSHLYFVLHHIFTLEKQSYCHGFMIYYVSVIQQDESLENRV